MRLVIQRVSEAKVSVSNELIGSITTGLCIFVGISATDDEGKAEYLADKIIRLRIFDDQQGKMNRSVVEIQGEILVVSQFTLYGECKKGNRPSFSAAAPPDKAERLYLLFVDRLRLSGLKVSTGKFQAKMAVALTNDGPVTFVLEA